MQCSQCPNQLKGRQRRFCSRVCSNKAINHKFKDYDAQQKRGKERKLQLVKLFGGKCSECGYSKCLGAMTFHHKNSKTKVMGLDVRHCSNNSWEKLLAEAKKCVLLCMNCHAARHWYLD